MTFKVEQIKFWFANVHIIAPPRKTLNAWIIIKLTRLGPTTPAQFKDAGIPTAACCQLIPAGL